MVGAGINNNRLGTDIYVRFDAVQSLTAGQKTQARQNLGMGTASLADTGSAGGQVPVWLEGGENGYLVGDGTGTIGAVAGIPGQSILGTFIALEDFRLTGDISPAQITADQHNYNPAGLASASTVRLTSDASRNITGLQGGLDGRLLLIHNVGTNAIVLKDESASSTAANRFALNSDITLEADQCAVLQYDSTSSRWRMAAGPTAILVNSAFAVLTDGATITQTCDTLKPEQLGTVTLGGNRTLAISGATNGMRGRIIVKQDGTGGRTLALPAGSKVVNGGLGAVTLTSAPNSVDILSWVYDGTNFWWTYGANFT